MAEMGSPTCVLVTLEPGRRREAAPRTLAPDEPDPRQTGHRDEQNHRW